MPRPPQQWAHAHDASPTHGVHTGRILRGVASAVLLVIGAIAVSTALVTGWARVQLVDEDAFVATLAPLSADPDVHDLVIAETTDTVSDALGTVVPGVDLPPAAARARDLLGAPALDAVRSLTEGAVTDVVRSERFSTVWTHLVRTSHRALVFGATSDGGGIIVQTADGLGVQVSGVVTAIAAELNVQGSPVAALLPPVDRVVVFSDGVALQRLRAVYAMATTAGALVPVAAILSLTAGVLISRRRRRALVGAGLAIVAGAGTVLLAVVITTTIASDTAVSHGLAPAGVVAVVRQLSSGLVSTSLSTLFLGGVVAVAAVIVRRRLRPAGDAASLPEDDGADVGTPA